VSSRDIHSQGLVDILGHQASRIAYNVPKPQGMHQLVRGHDDGHIAVLEASKGQFH